MLPSGPRERPAIFGLPVATTEPFERVAVGAALEAAGRHPARLAVPNADEEPPTTADLAASAEINERYQTTLHAHVAVQADGTLR